MARRKQRIWFDIETQAFSESFALAQTVEARLRLAPRMRLAVTFDGTAFRTFLPEDAPALIALLMAADEIITFNGKAFDLLVLRAHHRLEEPCPAAGVHTDLCEEIFNSEGRRVSLHDLSLLNLGKGKHTAGRSMVSLDLERLAEACRSDVRQTHVLWEVWRDGKLAIPPRRPGSSRFDRWIDERFDVGPGHHMPILCPRCHAANTLELIEQDVDEMSEGQASDYLAGMWGTAICHECGHELDYGF